MIDESSVPFLSVIIPVHNRQLLITRAIESVLRDAAADIELIVVDDGSADGTIASVLEFTDQRLRLVRLPVNGGQCAARNRGAEVARGNWLVFLDSDDELAPDGLSVIRATARTADPEVGKLLFSCRDDYGAVSPQPISDGREVDYAGYLQWQEATSNGASEALPATRRVAFLCCPYPEERSASEGIHELDYAKRWRIRLCQEIVRVYHYDAANRLMAPDTSSLLGKAADIAAHAEQMLARHGEAMRIHAPTRWRNCQREAAIYGFLSGNRRGGLHHSFRVLRRAPFSLNTWIALILGIAGPRPLSRVLALKRARATAA